MSNRFFPVGSYLLGALLCLLLIKLCCTGIMFCTSSPEFLCDIWQSRPALAGEEEELISKEPRDEMIDPGGETQPFQSQTKKELKALEIKRRQLEQREKALEEERKRLTALKEEINEKLSKVTEIQKAVQSDLEKKEALRSDRIKHLIKVYRTMPPRKAAVLIEKLDMNVIIALFSEMKGENVGQILPYVSPEKAAKISERLAKLGL